MRISRNVVRMAVSVCLLMAVLVPAVASPGKSEVTGRISGQALEKLAVTTTKRGRAVAEEAAQRYSKEHGVPTHPEDLRVYDLSGNGTDLFIAPAGLKVEYLERALDGDGNYRMAMAITTPERPEARKFPLK